MIRDFDDSAELDTGKKAFDAKKFFKEWVLPYGIEILVVVLFIKFVAFLTFVPTGSMETTIPEKSMVISTRLYNAAENVARGDIIVFYSDELETTLVKRCVGLPGDEIEISKDGSVYINGEFYSEPYAALCSGYSGEFTVPKGHYFFLGDNRPGSNDSRYWNEPYISEEKLIGKAVFTLWPFTSFGTLN